MAKLKIVDPNNPADYPDRVSIAHLRILIDRLNRHAGKPLRPGYGPEYAGQYQLSKAYGGYKLTQNDETGCGERDITIGYVSRKELYERISKLLTEQL